MYPNIREGLCLYSVWNERKGARTAPGRIDENFYIEITETRKTVIPVQAATEKEAVLKILSRYKQGEININYAAPGNFTMEAIKASEGTDLR